MPFGDRADNVLKILTVDIKQSFKNLTNIFIKSNSKKSLDIYHIGIVWYRKQKIRRENHNERLSI